MMHIICTQVTIDMGHRAPKGSVARRRGLVGVRTITMPRQEGSGDFEDKWANIQARSYCLIMCHVS